MRYLLFSRQLVFLLLMTFVSCGEPSSSPATKRSSEDSTENQLVKADGKKPMRLLSERPYNLETPLRYFMHDFTPNDVFFVRWHLSQLPEAVGEDTFRLRITGAVNRTLALSLNDLKTKFKPVKLAALCQCAGNARSSFRPRVAGAQWVNGGMGNAVWTGVLLKDILQAAGVKGNARFVSFNGLDAPPLSVTPDFEKSLTVPHAMDGEVMVAYEMNGAAIPLLNGFPLKLVVPGWYATYWVGMLSDITVHADTFRGYWMEKAYRVPKGVENGHEEPDKQAAETVPIGKMDVRSIFVFPEGESRVVTGKLVPVQGLAFDGGDSIVRVEVSADSGSTWQPARLAASLGRYSWRRWHFSYTPMVDGKHLLMVKATNAKGQTQPMRQWNRAGYMRNEIERLQFYSAK